MSATETDTEAKQTEAEPAGETETAGESAVRQAEKVASEPAVTARWYCTDCGHTTRLDGHTMKRCICGRYMVVRDDGGE
jgi:rubrerythrin